jgi:abortive infection bacteriophage resistance protein
MTLKPALSIHDQIELLRNRGMIIDSETTAAEFLSSNQYYRLNIYFHKLMDSPDHFRAMTHFSQVMAIYANDSWLRNKILTVLEPIEIKMRTQISYYLGMIYGPDTFYRKGIYKNSAICQSILENFTKEISRNKSDPVIKHHQTNYEGLFPIWVVIEYLSFNTLSKFYSNLQEQDKKAIAGSSYRINDYILGQWLHVLSIMRNICAHYGYLYHREYPVRPIIAKSFNWDASKDNKLFAVFLVMRRLSEDQTWQRFMQSLETKVKSSPFFSLQDYGFPDNWRDYLE